MPNLSGQSLGRYHLLEQLGEGGMAVVYKAYDTRLEREVAIKVIRSGAFPADTLDEALKRFEREAKSLAKLSHPNIVKVHDFGEHEGSPFLVMEYLPGGTLKRLLGKPIPWQEAVRLILPVARSVAYAHQRGILHRDIKPANILITESGEPMLSDFGIAKIFQGDQSTALTGSGMAIGTPEYMAPEQWNGNTSPQSDLYSLGIVLYEMVAGRKPYVADTPAAILIKQVTEPLPAPHQFAADLPEPVEYVLIKALAKDPQDRYPDVNALVMALENLQRSMPASAPVSTPLEPAPSVSTQAVVHGGSKTILPADVPETRKAIEPLVSAIPIGRRPLRRRWIVAFLGAVTIIFCVATIIVGGGIGIIAPRLFSAVPSLTEIAASTAKVTFAPTTLRTALLLSPTPAAALIPSSTPGMLNPSGKIVFSCQISRQPESNEICLMNADGSQFQQLTYDGANNGYPSMSPDGKSIVYSSDISGSSQVYEMNLATGAVQQLTYPPGNGSASDISPDGNYIVYKHSDQLDAIWVMNRDGSNPHEVYNIGWDPAWSPDGSQILFASGSLNQPQLFLIDSNGSNLRQLTNISNLRGRSDWSSKGLIATYAGLSSSRSIFVMNEDGTDLKQITSGGNSLAPCFSPDGNWIAFTAYIDHPGDVNGCEIYIMPVDGSDIHRLTNNDYCDWQPRWGP
jgi:serine/threonine protein kinase